MEEYLTSRSLWEIVRKRREQQQTNVLGSQERDITHFHLKFQDIMHMSHIYYKILLILILSQ